jgi:hypothetical protein
MNGNAVIGINTTAFEDEGAFDNLIAAANDVMNASGKDFSTMKNKAWYKRLWELVTFSKDNEKRLAKGVGSLAQMQDIVIKMMLMLSKENPQIAALVEENRDTINKILESLNVQGAELLSLKKALSHATYYNRVKLSDISPKDKRIIFCAVRKYLLLNDVNACPDKELVNNYFRNFHNAIGIDETPDDERFDFSAVNDLLDKKSDELYFTVIAELTSLLGKSAEGDTGYDEAVHHVSLSKPKQASIWKRINGTVQSEGKDGIVSGYYENDLPSFYIDLNDLELMDVEVDQAINPVVLEPLSIDTILHIPTGEENIFYAKEIRLNASVHCEGNLIFDHCVIVYDYNSNANRINVGKAGSIVISHSTIIGTCNGELQEKQNKYFIEAENYQGSKLTATDSLFKDCYLFAKHVSAYLENCKVLYTFLPPKQPNRIWHFIYADGDDSTIKNCSVENTINWLEKNESLVAIGNKVLKEEISESAGISLLRNLHNMPTEKYSDEAVMIESEKYECNHHGDFYISDALFPNVGIIDQTTFKNIAQPCFSCGSKVTNCEFNDCCSAKNEDIYSKRISLFYRCLFTRCRNIVVLGGKSKVQHCQFIACSGNLLKITGPGGTDIEYCGFFNIKSTDAGRYRKRGIEFDLYDGKSSNGCHIAHCTFDGIYVSEENRVFIECWTSGDWKHKSAVAISDCDFRHCFSETGKLIDTNSNISTLLGSKDINTVYISSDCRGLENLNKEGSNAENVFIHDENSSDAPIGARLDDANIGMPIDIPNFVIAG